MTFCGLDNFHVLSVLRHGYGVVLFLCSSIVVSDWPCLRLMFYESVHIQQENTKALWWLPAQLIATLKPDDSAGLAPEFQGLLFYFSPNTSKMLNFPTRAWGQEAIKYIRILYNYQRKIHKHRFLKFGLHPIRKVIKYNRSI